MGGRGRGCVEEGQGFRRAATLLLPGIVPSPRTLVDQRELKQRCGMQVTDVTVGLQTQSFLGLTIPVSPPLMVKSKLQYFFANPKRLMIMAVNAPAAPKLKEKHIDKYFKVEEEILMHGSAEADHLEASKNYFDMFRTMLGFFSRPIRTTESIFAHIWNKRIKESLFK